MEVVVDDVCVVGGGLISHLGQGVDSVGGIHAREQLPGSARYTPRQSQFNHSNLKLSHILRLVVMGLQHSAVRMVKGSVS